MNPGRYSLWLMPDGDAYDYYFESISLLSRRLKTPAFAPHVTLFGLIRGRNEEIESNIALLASRLRPFPIEFTKVDSLNEYHRCLFLCAKETPAILKAHQQALELFGRETDAPFMPHLSLVYGNLEPEIKRRISVELGGMLFRSFDAYSLHLFLTAGEPPDWERICEIPFGKEQT